MYCHRIWVLHSVAIGLICWGGTAQAATIPVSFSGSVAGIDAPLAAYFSTGDSLSGSYSFDSLASATGGSNSQFAVFNSLETLSFTVGSYSASTTGAPEIQVDNDPPGPNVDRYAVVARAGDGLTGPSLGPWHVTSFIFRLDDSTNTVFSNALDQPVSLSLSDFTSSLFFVFFENDRGDLATISGELRSFDMPAGATVPEPSSLALAAFGLLGAWSAARRTRRSTQPATL